MNLNLLEINYSGFAALLATSLLRIISTPILVSLLHRLRFLETDAYIHSNDRSLLCILIVLMKVG